MREQVSVFHCFLALNNISAYVYTIVFIHPSYNGLLSCFYFLTIMNNAAMSTHVQVFKWMCHSFLLGIYFRVKSLDHMVTMFNIFGKRQLKQLYHFTFLPVMFTNSSFSTSSPVSLLLSIFFTMTFLEGMKWCVCGFDLHFSDSQ